MSKETDFIFSIQIETSEGIKEFLIPESQFIIGRSKECGVFLDEPSLSRQHLRISRSQSKVIIADLGSSNGSYLNGKKLSPFEETPLSPSSRVRLSTKEIWLSLTLVPLQNIESKESSSKKIHELRDELEKKAEQMRLRELAFEAEFQNRLMDLERQQKDLTAKKAEILFDAEAQGEVEYQKKYKEAQALIQEAEKKCNLIIQNAKKEASEFKEKSEESFRQELLRFREKNELLRKKFDEDLAELKTASRKEQENLILQAKDEAQKIISEGESRAADKIQEAIEREKNIIKECESKAHVLAEVEEYRKQLQNLQRESEDLRQSLENLKNAEIEKQRALQESETLRREADEYSRQKKMEADEKLKSFEREMESRVSKENAMLSELKLKNKEHLDRESQDFQSLLREKKYKLSESLTQFLQVYMVEKTNFDFRTVKNEDLVAFKEAFHENILREIGEPADSGQVAFAPRSRWPRIAWAMASLLFIVLFLPSFLPEEMSSKFSLLPSFNIERSSARFIASLEQNRERRVETPRLNQVFDSYLVSVMLTDRFADSRLDESYLKSWYKQAERDFFRKYRISEEKMIQVLAKETSLIKGLSELFEQAHPDYFGVTYSKMKSLEDRSLMEIRKTLGEEGVYKNFLEASKDHFSRTQLKGRPITTF